jgi:hypothetical protein
MKKFIPFIVFLLFISSCEKEVSDAKKNFEIKGLAQKGPYRSGTNITVIELIDNLNATGLNYYTTVTDNFGGFSISDVELSSNYAELMADGFYFNENWGGTTNLKLVLKAITDLSVQSDININILTHISVDRIKYLVQNEGKTYNDAKLQAQNEILKIFNLEDDNTQNYEQLDISKEGELNSKLLAISCIIQANRSIADLTELLADISSDIKTDGLIDSPDLQSKLATTAVLCNLGGIRENLAEYYNNDSVFNTFKYHVKHFIENTEFESLADLNFLENTSEGKNLIALSDNSTLHTDSAYCLASNLSNVNLDDVFIGYTIIKLSESGIVKYSPIDLTAWSYDTHYCSSVPSLGIGCGISIASYNCRLASEIPLSIQFEGSGEILLTINFNSSELPDNGGSYRMQKYFKW